MKRYDTIYKSILLLFLATACVSPITSQITYATISPTIIPLTHTQAVTSFPTQYTTITSFPTKSPTTSSTSIPLINVRVMTYNILYGAGADPQFDAQAGSSRPNRFSELMTILKKADPDILGIQEASGWNKGKPTIIEKVAKELNMNYFITDNSHNNLPLAILTKYQIIETEDLSDQICINGALRARLLSPNNLPINIFVVHLAPYPSGESMRIGQTAIITRMMEQYAHEVTFLIGDLNSGKRSEENKIIEKAGWDHIIGNWLDHIWISPEISWSLLTNQFGYSDYEPILNSVSDHYPVFVEISVLQNPTIAKASTPIPSKPIMPIPSIISDTLIDAQVININRFDQNYKCAKMLWFSSWKNEKVVNEMLEINGKYNWSAGVTYPGMFYDKEGSILDFHYERNGEFEIFLDSGEWKTPSYRRIGIYM